MSHRMKKTRRRLIGVVGMTTLNEFEDIKIVGIFKVPYPKGKTGPCF